MFICLKFRRSHFLYFSRGFGVVGVDIDDEFLELVMCMFSKYVLGWLCFAVACRHCTSVLRFRFSFVVHLFIFMVMLF